MQMSSITHVLTRSFMTMFLALSIAVPSGHVIAQDDQKSASLLHARQLMQIVEAGGKGYFASGAIMHGQATIAIPALTSIGAVVVPPNVSSLVVTTSMGEVLAAWSRSSGELRIGEEVFSPVEIYAKEQGKSVEIVLGLFLKDGGSIKCEGEDAPAKIAIRGIEFSKDPKSDVHGNWPMPEERKVWDTKLINSAKPFEQRRTPEYRIASQLDSLYPGRFTWISTEKSTPSLQLELRLYEISGTSTIDFLTNTRIEIWCDGELTVDAPLMALVSASVEPAVPQASTLRCDTRVSTELHPLDKDHNELKDNLVFSFRWPMIHLQTKAIALEYNGKAKRVQYRWSEMSTDLPAELYKVKFRCETDPYFRFNVEDQSVLIVGKFVDSRRTSYLKHQYYQLSLAESQDICDFPMAPLESVGRIFDDSSRAAYRGRWLYADPIFLSKGQSLSRKNMFDVAKIQMAEYDPDVPYTDSRATIFMMYTYN